ncbi:hypothetical protein HYW74_02575 [Candidatus Pacearchaeota archaeon]|nr:hypothetical protein [Candidatus Pacearchaeota archaeon]
MTKNNIEVIGLSKQDKEEIYLSLRDPDIRSHFEFVEVEKFLVSSRYNNYVYHAETDKGEVTVLLINYNETLTIKTAGKKEAREIVKSRLEEIARKAKQTISTST